MIVNLIFLTILNISTGEIGDYLRAKGMPIKVNGINLVKKEKLVNSYDVFLALNFAFNTKGYRHVIREVLYHEEVAYSLGSAVMGGGFSWSACSDVNERAVDICKAATAHEIGHAVFRLKHSGTNLCRDLMDSNALGCPGLKDLGFSAAQKYKMQFIKKHRRKK